MKGIATLVKMLISVLVTLLILTILLMLSGAGIYVAAFISLSGFVNFGISGVVFWLGIYYCLAEKLQTKAIGLFVSVIAASLLSGMVFEVISSDFTVGEIGNYFISQVVVMPIALFSALIYVVLLSR